MSEGGDQNGATQDDEAPIWKRLAAVFAAGGLLVCGLAGVPLWLLNEQQSDQRKEAAGAQPDTTEEECKIVSAITALDCAAKKIAATRSEKREEADLQAQQEMSRWALGTFIFAGVGILTSIAGVLLVFDNLRLLRLQMKQAGKDAAAQKKRFDDELAQLKRANEIAETNGQAQTRCYLAIENVRLTFGKRRPIDPKNPDKPELIRPTIMFDVVNYGNSPSRGFVWWPSIKYTHRPPHSDRNAFVERQSHRGFPIDPKKHALGIDIPTKGREPRQTTYGFDMTPDEIAAYRGSLIEGGLRIDLVISYYAKDVFGRPERGDVAYSVVIADGVEGMISMMFSTVLAFETQDELKRINAERAALAGAEKEDP